MRVLRISWRGQPMMMMMMIMIRQQQIKAIMDIIHHAATINVCAWFPGVR